MKTPAVHSQTTKRVLALLGLLSLLTLHPLSAALAQSASDSQIVKLASSIDLKSPLGIRMHRTTCTDLASRLGATRESLQSSEGVPARPEGNWQRTVHAYDCSAPKSTIAGLTVTLQDLKADFSSDASRSLFDATASRFVAADSGWSESERDADPSTFGMKIRRFYGHGMSVTLNLASSYVILEFRAIRNFAVAGAASQKAIANPFGVVIGVHTCRDAAKILEGVVEKVDRPARRTPPLDWVRVRAVTPDKHYPDSTILEANCYTGIDSEVDDLTIYVKNGDGNLGARDAYRTLLEKYRRVDGSVIPPTGAGYARFSSAGAEIELEVPMGGKEFSITYTESELFESVRSSERKKRKAL